MVEAGLEGLAGLRQLVVGGDVVGVRDVERVLEAMPGCAVIDGYGPTESSVFACCHLVKGKQDVHPSVPIGRAIE